MSWTDQPPFLIAIAGGSCAGKTTLARALRARLGEESCVHIEQDRFYRDLSHRFDRDGGSVNFDHPDSLDFDLLVGCLDELLAGRPASLPRYDFSTHRRSPEADRVRPAPWILLEGTLILRPEPIRLRTDLGLWLECAEDVRARRRLDRDLQERGRTREGVLRQLEAHVRPMHDRFVEPSREWARHVLSGEGEPDVDLVVSWVSALRERRVRG